MVSKRVSGLLGEIEDHMENVFRRLQLRLMQVLSVETPVLTGFARAGWSPSTGAPDRTGPSKAPQGVALGLAKSQAAALLASRLSTSEGLAQSYVLADGVIFIVNNVFYMKFLNDGTSAQAPKLFVEMSLATSLRATAREFGGG